MCVFKWEGHSKNVYFLSIKHCTLRLATHRSFSLLSAGFPNGVHFQRNPQFEYCCQILNSTQRPSCVFVMSFLLRDFVLMASDKPFDDHSGLWLLLSHIILSQTCSKFRNDSIEDSEVDNCMTLWKMQVNCRFSSFPPISSCTEWHHINTVWLPRQLQNGGLQSLFFQDEFLKDSRHFRGWNFGEWKSWIFTCYKWRQKE